MPEQEQGLGALFLEAMFKKYDDLSTFISSSAIPKFKRFVKIVFYLFIAFFLVSLLLMMTGIALEENNLTALGRIGLVITGVILLMIASLIGFAFAGKKYMTFVRSFAIYQLLVTLVLWASPMPITLPILFGLSLAGCLLALINAVGETMLFVKVGTSLIFIGLLATAYFPSWRDKLYGGIVEMNEPELIKITSGEISNGKIRLFLRGKPAIWYFVDTKGQYQLFNHDGYHDIFQVRLKPITSEIAAKLMENEKLISPRNFVYNTAYTGPPPATNEPTPMVAIPADTPSTSPPEPAQSPAAPELSPAPAPVSNPPVNIFQQPDNRKEYAVIAVDENYRVNRFLGEAMVSWIGAQRAVHAYDYVENIAASEGGIDYGSRAQLSKVAKKIVYVAYKTNFDREEKEMKYFSAHVLFRVIDAENGTVLYSPPNKHISNIKGQKGIAAENDTKNQALEFAFRAIRNECKKYM
ncbi:MAG: hypothetical protein WC608_02175 [Parcubacteria group bacterium]